MYTQYQVVLICEQNVSLKAPTYKQHDFTFQAVFFSFGKITLLTTLHTILVRFCELDYVAQAYVIPRVPTTCKEMQ